MSNTALIIEERSRDIGDFMVGRIIPFRKKRMVGPFIFIDHMGPSEIGPGHYMDVDQHPHIGLSTLTYLFEGEIMHADSIGTHKRIVAGSVGLMTAGSGVTHTERTPPDWRDGNTRPVHGFQIWVALPKALESMAPRFDHLEPGQHPRWEAEGLTYTLLAGKGYGHESPLPVHSPLFLLTVESGAAEADWEVIGGLEGEIGIAVVKGYVEACGETIDAGQTLVSKTQDTCRMTVGPNSLLLVFGGEAFAEPREIYWNFVATTKERIEEAKTQWRNRAFPKTPNDNTYVPMPGN